MVQRNGLFDLYDKGLDEEKVKKIFKTITKKFGKASGTNIIHKVIPRLTHSENHWYRDIYFKQKKGDKYVDIDGDYLIKTGETWLKRDKDGNAKEEESKRDWDAYLPGTEKEVKEMLAASKTLGVKKTLTPITAADVDNEKSSKELKEAINDLTEIIGENRIQLAEAYLAQDFFDKQYQDGRRGMVNKRLLDLINNYAWYKYDGTEATATKINEDREKNKDNLLQKLETNTNPLKKRITFSDNIIQAGALLQQSDDLDSKYAYKDLKELLVELKYYKRDDLRDPVRKVLTWPLYKTGMGETWPAGEKNTELNKYGVKILSEEAVKAEFGETESVYEKTELEKVKNKIIEKEREIDEAKKNSSDSETDRDKKVKDLEKELESLKDEYESTKLRLLEESTTRTAASGTDEELAKTLQSLQTDLAKETKENIKNSIKKRIKIIEDEQKKRKGEVTKDNKSNEKSTTKPSENSNSGKNNTNGNNSSGSNLNKDKDKDKDKNTNTNTKTSSNNNNSNKGIKDDPVFRKLKARYGQGYKKDEYVVAPVTGK